VKPTGLSTGTLWMAADFALTDGERGFVKVSYAVERH
jgi:hypothetical protein